MVTKYERLVNDEVIELSLGNEEKTLYQVMNFACCDCGMVHKLYLSKQKGDEIAFAAVSWPGSTAQLRRNRYGNLHRGVGKWKLVRTEEE